ncbi:hypothetical protein [Maribacter polysaccharolyticus]|uniref:hypothetical protein n=1 Tax=Maribacter polysaccharolyticus TaxID=3020831 RepID=UPI00237F6711|nr:hypothetical protein [Maribacter polysaccharolyticus]MDE3742529.1 hypothetical protein [Maribacter polysaccharolyticus]
MKKNQVSFIKVPLLKTIAKRFNTKNGALFLLALTALLQVQCGSTKRIAEKKDQSDSQGIPALVDEAWLEATQGNMPLVISVPHGGSIKPTEIPDRTCGARVADNNTGLLAYDISDALEQQGKKPFLIVSQIARTKIDLNRDREEATCGNAVMNDTWDQYHKYIEEAISEAVEKYGYALYIDLHGQSHKVKRLELGYLLRKPDLEKNRNNNGIDPELDAKSSLRNLLKLTKDQTLKELLIGENALGTLFEANGYPAVPSLGDPYPQEDEAYFTGGYNTRRYTSYDSPQVFGLQIEANFTGIRDSEENRKKFAKAFASTINDYLGFVASAMK